MKNERFKKTKKRHEHLVDVINAAKISTEPPGSGSYQGTSSESDNGDQDIRTKLHFAADGSITGYGHDSADGQYTIVDGAWAILGSNSQPTVVWTEKYRKGFHVLVRGIFEPDGTTIKAHFASSKGVQGTFVLTPMLTPWGGTATRTAHRWQSEAH